MRNEHLNHIMLMIELNNVLISYVRMYILTYVCRLICVRHTDTLMTDFVLVVFPI